MLYSEAKAIRAEILSRCPNCEHKARNISRVVMRSLMNEREDMACSVLGGMEHLAHDYDIDDRYAVQLERALRLAKGVREVPDVRQA